MNVKYYLLGLILIKLLFFVGSKEVSAQENYLDVMAVNIPDSVTYSVENLAGYIDREIEKDENKVRVLFVWIVNNISYDVENAYSLDNNDQKNSSITLLKRKGICDNYASLFHDVLSLLNIESHIVTGYTKIKRRISSAPHSWCVVKLDSEWSVYDPTWGSGNINETNFSRQVNMSYYKMRPQKAIFTHMPFDPLWQLLEYPSTSVEFRHSKKGKRSVENYFNVSDSLKLYSQQSYIERLKNIRRRIKQNVVGDYMTFVHVKEIENKMEQWQYENVVSKYHEALNLYKEGIYTYNEFIDFRNKLFKPDKGDEYLIEMMDSMKTSFQSSLDSLKNIKNADPNTLRLMNHLRKFIKASMKNVKIQEAFLKKVLSTPKNYRKSLFYEKM
ncbi:transglutaminase domain-containing protein [Marinifilum fragile]|uniref:transglutaminase domain-containing protein n=1 Tax=Marinifilum fragile TaxID=570161 RepID=UPI002AA82BC6|nr:transglutaminase domain-containing protein [Marinifilum fragile]